MIRVVGKSPLPIRRRTPQATLSVSASSSRTWPCASSWTRTRKPSGLRAATRTTTTAYRISAAMVSIVPTRTQLVPTEGEDGELKRDAAVGLRGPPGAEDDRIHAPVERKERREHDLRRRARARAQQQQPALRVNAACAEVRESTHPVELNAAVAAHSARE
jgi:hypothetical protein